MTLRTWWWAQPEQCDGDALRRAHELLGRAEIQCARAESSAQLAAATAFGFAAQPFVDGSAARALAPAGEQRILVLASATTVARRIAEALSLGESSLGALDVRPGSLTVIDWPDTDDARGRPVLVGLDVDWLPPPPAQQRAKFPGGPGSAPSARG